MWWGRGYEQEKVHTLPPLSLLVRWGTLKKTKLVYANSPKRTMKSNKGLLSQGLHSLRKKWHLGSKIAGTSGRCQGAHKNVRDSQELGMFKDRKGQGDKG